MKLKMPFHDENDDDVSILDQRAPHARPPAHQQVRNIVDGFFIPFMNCVQPPLNACIATAVQHERFDRQSSRREQSKSMSSHVTPMISRASADFSVNSKNSSATSGITENCMLSSRSRQRLRESNLIGLPEKTRSTQVNVNDVLCGRGNSVSNHVGNLNFRDLIDANKGDYNNLTKKEKIMLARRIVEYVMYHTDPPGRFIARDSASGLWYDIGLPRSLEKTSQALREKSAPVAGVAGKAACISYCVNSVVSFDECASDSIEVESQFQETSAKELSRAVTVKMNNHRNVPVKQPTCIVPEHLQKVYRYERVVPPSPSGPNSSSFLTTPVTIYSPDVYQRHLILQGQGDPSAPFSPSSNDPSKLMKIDAVKRTVFGIPGQPAVVQSAMGVGLLSTHPQNPQIVDRPLTSTPTFESSPPRRCLQMPLASATIVTPNRHCSNGLNPSIESERKMKVLEGGLSSATDYSIESIFPLDVFENPEYHCGANASHGSPQQGRSTVSPLREQKHSKRRRLLQPSMDASWDPCCVELDTSWESLNTTTSKLEEENGQVTQRLVEAIGSQLKLDDLLSPSEMLQSYAGGRRRHEPLPRPPKATPALDTSADSADGMAALSSAAFLRLDESF
jgi:hypothetical protein